MLRDRLAQTICADVTSGQRRIRHTVGTETAREPWNAGGMEFAPAIDPKVAAAVARTGDLGCSAVVWRAGRRRAQRLRIATPCYESVRLLVRAERDRRARLAAVLATLAEIAVRRIPVLPEDIPRIHDRHLTRYRAHIRGVRHARPP